MTSDKHQQHKRPSKSMASSAHPCYSDRAPPECGFKVVVRCDRVDGNGVWGSLPGWGSNCSAYIPIGFVVAQRGRGERRAQADFLTRAKRQASKDKPLLVVAEVESIEVTSCTGVDQVGSDGLQISDNFLVTLTRRGLDKVEEKTAMEALTYTQYCGALLVDAAATNAGASLHWAREVCLYGPYGRAAKSSSRDKNESDENLNPLRVAAFLLVNQIGALDHIDENAIKDILQPCDGGEDWHMFASKLWELCRRERLRTTKHIPVSISGTIGDHTEISEMIRSGVDSAGAVRVTNVTSAIEAIIADEPPEACSRLKVCVEGAGKFGLSTQSPPESSEEAELYLQRALQKANKLYAANASKSIVSTEQGKVTKQEALADSKEKSNETTQPTLSIGLIGDVANGKSTLVRAITGKRTQSHSTEQQKHEMTIRLGFANASVLRCQSEVCGLFSFRQDEARPAPSDSKCSYCGSDASLVTRVSLIDCPGHAELMATMLSGASAFDAVILAAAANVPCPSPQARQHLEALKMSDIAKQNGRVVVVQTKAELAGSTAEGQTGLSANEKLKLHAENGKENLCGTVAAGAPFFPACAPMGLGLEPLAAWLAELSTQGLTSNHDYTKRNGNFKVLRSFDINCAGLDATKLVGGVLGGSITGGDAFFRPGDMVEIRPGLVLGSTKGDGDASEHRIFNVEPLQFEIKEIMTDKTSLQTARAGGLVALRTTLCPSLCADDRLVGSVVGHTSGTSERFRMPPVFGPTLFLEDLCFIQAPAKKSLEKMLKKDDNIRCHSGSSTVTGKVVRVSAKRKKLQLKLDKPICGFRNSTVAIEAKVSGGQFEGYSLVAHACINGGSVCIEGGDHVEDHTDVAHDKCHTWESAAGSHYHNDVDEDLVRRQFLEALDEVRLDSGESVNGLVSVPSPSVAKDGGTHVLIENFALIALALNREPAQLQTYLTKEGGLSCARAGETGGALRVRYKTRGFSELLRRIIRRYVSVYVMCQQCKSARTELLKQSSTKHTTELLCRQCNARRFVPKLS